MTFRFMRPVLRPVTLLALALGLSACGSKAEFDINVAVSGLEYDNFVIVDKISGATLKVEKNAAGTYPTALVFPRRLEYGDQYQLEVQSDPLHQTCSGGATDTAGRLSEIRVVFACRVRTPDITGAIDLGGVTDASVVGLKLTNGSTQAFTAVAGNVLYSFPSIPYNTSYGIVIAAQATDGKTLCKLAPQPYPNGQPVTGVLTADGLGFSGVMGDDNINIKVVCTAKPA